MHTHTCTHARTYTRNTMSALMQALDNLELSQQAAYTKM
jgi:hypothetical protein